MSFLTYIASEYPIPESEYLWKLYQGAEDIYTEKEYIAEVIPDLQDLEGLAEFLKTLPEETEVWHIWQGIACRPVIRTKEIPAQELTAEDIRKLIHKDVLNETATEYDIPVQYRLVLKPQEEKV